VKHSLLILTLTASLVASAQEAGLNGKWQARWTGESGTVLVADVEINGSSGTWRTLRVRSGKNNCVGMEHPLQVTRTDTGEIHLKALGSQALSGCPDFSIRLVRRVDERTYEGTRGSLPLTLTKQ
jgi:hypothetical protein